MSFWTDKYKEDRHKEQSGEIAAPEGAIISPDTHRPQRIPPGQSRTKKWPVLDASGPPSIHLDTWKFRVFGLVAQSAEWTWREFLELPRVNVFADFHCVTRWSRLGNLWEGVSTREILERAGGPRPEAGFVLAHGYDRGFTTNIPLAEFLAEDALIAISHDGEPLSVEHGGPARLVVPRLSHGRTRLARRIGGRFPSTFDEPSQPPPVGRRVRRSPGPTAAGSPADVRECF